VFRQEGATLGGLHLGALGLDLAGGEEEVSQLSLLKLARLLAPGYHSTVPGVEPPMQYEKVTQLVCGLLTGDHPAVSGWG
jgi:hypothetical protein